MTNLSFNLEVLSEMSEHKERTHLSDDLELAAEIGKNLLERNKELECLLKSSHQYLEEQAMKNDFLEKQLEALREVNENRNKAFEQMETTALELQRANQKLQNEKNSMKKRYRDLAEIVDSMDVRCEEYRKEVEELQNERTRLQRDLSMALSIHEDDNLVNNEASADVQIKTQEENNEERQEKERQLEELNVKISKLKEQQALERNKREELEYELSELIQENQQLESQLRVFAERSEEWQVSSGNTSAERAIDILPEIILNESAESLEDDSFVVVSEQLSRQSSAVSDHSAVVVLSPSEERTNSASFFSELGDQYHELVRKYDALLDKCKQEGLGKHSLPIPKVQRAVQVSPLPSPVEPRHSGRRRYFSESDVKDKESKIKEYKKMFAKIYSRIEESKNWPGRPYSKDC